MSQSAVAYRASFLAGFAAILFFSANVLSASDAAEPAAANASTAVAAEPLFAETTGDGSLPLTGRATYEQDVVFAKVIDKARKLASQGYQQPPAVPAFMQSLTYPEYQNIRFDPEKSLWRDQDLPFQVMFIAPGLFYKHPVKINIVMDNEIQPLQFNRDWFVFSDPELEKRVPHDLGYAGLKLTYPINTPEVQDQFMVFAGASYFRGVAAGNAWGLSARGIAVNTGLSQGEEFPSFVEFWMEPPAADATSFILYALLDGPSISGAYRFTITPGEQTTVGVDNVLFPRQDIELLGVAPLTSMFFYGENMTRPAGEWRPEVHDSDGLLIQDGLSGEWLWRPLLNPESLEMDYFATRNVSAFGLIHRAEDYNEFKDMEAHYERRPSVIVRPREGWGEGSIVLTQLPTDNETNDNIVAFWKPGQPVKAGGEFSFGYDMVIGTAATQHEATGKTRHTFVGDGNRIGGGTTPGAYRFIIDFEGGPLTDLSPEAKVLSEVSLGGKGELIEHFAQYNRVTGQWRLSILAKPAANQSLTLRGFLKLEEDSSALTETWNYRLPWNNSILRRNE